MLVAIQSAVADAVAQVATARATFGHTLDLGAAGVREDLTNNITAAVAATIELQEV